MEDRQEGAENQEIEENRRRLEEAITRLALLYRSGDRSALGPLHDQLAPVIHGVVRAQLYACYPLPPDLEPEDLSQQGYVALAEAALGWLPERNASFLPYFLSSFPWRIARYLQAHTPARRTRRFRLLSVPHDSLMEWTDGVAGLDGRDWDGALICLEMLGDLPEMYARVVRLHLFQGLSFKEIGEAVGSGRSAAHESFGRALSLLKSRMEGPGDGSRGRKPAPPDDMGGPDRAILRRCVELLHRLAPRGVPLPGGKIVCREAGLTCQQYRKIMERLQKSGCLVGRRRGTPGCLAQPGPAETMRALGI